MIHDLTLELLHQAQAGQEKALNTFSELARERIYVFIYRLTLDLDCTEDLTQETLVELIRSLNRLSFSHINLFWAWLHRTALGKVQHFYRIQGNKRIQAKTHTDSDRLKKAGREDSEGINRMIKDELKKAVCDAMRTLNLAHRSILTLRCFEQLSYPEIASITGQSELQARVQFFRAKQSLRKQLTQRGFGKDQFLATLGLLATITERVVKKTSAPVRINQATLSVSGSTVALGILASKAGITATVLILAGAIVGGTHLSNHWDHFFLQPRKITLRQAYNTFSNPSRVIETHTPEGTTWQAKLRDSVGHSVTQSVVEDILLRYKSRSFLYLIMPESHWVHLEFPGPLTDGPGADILIEVRNPDQGPRLFVTDGNDLEMEIPPAQNQVSGVGFFFTGYDLADLNIPFTPRAVRLEGCGTRANNTSLVLWVVKARIEGF